MSERPLGEAGTFELRDAWLRSRRLAMEAVRIASDRCEDYAKAALAMKAEGTPATVIAATVKGEKAVNEKLFERVLAEGKYRAAMKAIDVYRDDERMTYDEYRRSMEGR